MRYVIAAAMLLGSSGCATADHSPEHTLENKVLMTVAPCSDKVTKRKGSCAVFVGKDGVPYLGFKTMDGVVQFIRKVTDDGYEDVYVHGRRPA